MGGGTRAAPVAGEIADAELVKACRQGDERAWAMLVERFSRYVYAIAARIYRLPEQDAEDVFQEVFARTYEHLDRLRQDESIRPWIGQLTRRLAVDRLRVRRREQAGLTELETSEATADQELERLEFALGIQTALATLPEHCQEILDRFFARGESYQEISGALEIPMGTIASRISRCLAQLRKQLDDPGRG